MNCKIAGPNLNNGDLDWVCRTHGVLCNTEESGVMYCPVSGLRRYPVFSYEWTYSVILDKLKIKGTFGPFVQVRDSKGTKYRFVFAQGGVVRFLKNGNGVCEWCSATGEIYGQAFDEDRVVFEAGISAIVEFSKLSR